MLAFVNTEMTKDEFMSNLRAHAAHDEIVRGLGYDGRHGCLVGCSFNEYDHYRGPAIAGVPVELWHLADVIHEGLTDEPHLFPLAFGDAIRVGADLTKIHWQFLVWLLTDDTHGVKRFSGDPAWGVAAAIDQVSALCARMAVDDLISRHDWGSARDAALAAGDVRGSARDAALAAGYAGDAGDAAAHAATRAAAHAAYAAVHAATRDAALAAGDVRGSARDAALAAGYAGYAAYAAVHAAARDAALAAYVAMRDKLIELLKAA